MRNWAKDTGMLFGICSRVQDLSQPDGSPCSLETEVMLGRTPSTVGVSKSYSGYPTNRSFWV